MQPKEAFKNISSKLDAGRSRKSNRSGIDRSVEVFPFLALRIFVGTAESVISFIRK
ncbi:hypothetical protein TNCT_505981, partial [Trichonephila clavata]